MEIISWTTLFIVVGGLSLVFYFWDYLSPFFELLSDMSNPDRRKMMMQEMDDQNKALWFVCVLSIIFVMFLFFVGFN